MVKQLMKRYITPLLALSVLLLISSCKNGSARSLLDLRFNQVSLKVSILNKHQVRFSIVDLVLGKEAIIQKENILNKEVLQETKILWSLKTPNGKTEDYQKNIMSNFDTPTLYSVPDSEKSEFILKEMPFGMDYAGNIEVTVKVMKEGEEAAIAQLAYDLDPTIFNSAPQPIVRGTVMKANWSAHSDFIKGAYVIIKDNETHHLYETVTDNKGRYSFNLKRESIYDLFILVEGQPLSHFKNVKFTTNPNDYPPVFALSSTGVALPSNFFKGDITVSIDKGGLLNSIVLSSASFNVRGRTLKSDGSPQNKALIVAIDSKGAVYFTYSLLSSNNYYLTLYKNNYYHFSVVAPLYSYNSREKKVLLSKDEEQAQEVLRSLELKGGWQTTLLVDGFTEPGKFGREIFRLGNNHTFRIETEGVPSGRTVEYEWSLNDMTKEKKDSFTTSITDSDSWLRVRSKEGDKIIDKSMNIRVNSSKVKSYTSPSSSSVASVPTASVGPRSVLPPAVSTSLRMEFLAGSPIPSHVDIYLTARGSHKYAFVFNQAINLKIYDLLNDASLLSSSKIILEIPEAFYRREFSLTNRVRNFKQRQPIVAQIGHNPDLHGVIPSSPLTRISHATLVATYVNSVGSTTPISVPLSVSSLF